MVHCIRANCDSEFSAKAWKRSRAIDRSGGSAGGRSGSISARLPWGRDGFGQCDEALAHDTAIFHNRRHAAPWPSEFFLLILPPWIWANDGDRSFDATRVDHGAVPSSI